MKERIRSGIAVVGGVMAAGLAGVLVGGMTAGIVGGIVGVIGADISVLETCACRCRFRRWSFV
jgi:hypothetical protein